MGVQPEVPLVQVWSCEIAVQAYSCLFVSVGQCLKVVNELVCSAYPGDAVLGVHMLSLDIFLL